MGKNKNELSDFYCTQCGKKGLPVMRFNGKYKEPGHLKKLYCLYCRTETNHCEVRPTGKYTYMDFIYEFTNGAFSKEGLRVNKVEFAR